MENGDDMRKFVGVGLIIIIILGAYMLLSDEKMIHIGVIGDFSNSLSTESVDTFRAVELAIEELDPENEKYSLRRYDFSELTSVDQLKNRINNNHTDILIGPSTSSHFLTVEEGLRNLDIPVFMPTVSTKEAHGEVDNLFGISGTIAEQSACLVDRIVQNEAEAKVTIYYTSQNMGFSRTFAELSKEYVLSKNMGSIDNMVEIGNISESLTHEKLRLKIDSDQAIIVAPPGYAGNVAQLIATNNPDVSLYFSGWSKSEATLEYVKSLSNNMYFVTVPPTKNSEVYDEFAHKLENEKKANVNTFSKASYELMIFINMILEEHEPKNLSDYQAAIHGLSHYSGIFNDYEFNEYGDGKRGYAVYKVVDGEFVYVGGCK